MAPPAPLVVSNSFLVFCEIHLQKEILQLHLSILSKKISVFTPVLFHKSIISPLFETKSEIMKLNCHFLTSTLPEVKSRTILILPGPPRLSNPVSWYVLLPSKLIATADRTCKTGPRSLVELEPECLEPN